VVDNLNNIDLANKYDVVTMIGVLEYAGKYTGSSQPYRDFLLKAKSFLNPKGQVIIAIENRFGLKYWAGFSEDHLGTYYTGLEGYDNAQGIKTFGRMELESLLAEAGFSDCTFFYPIPDYKFPTQIFSDDYNMFHNELDLVYENYDHDRFKLFDEARVMHNIICENQLHFFSNSFLVFAKP
jgi:hypothetical protein